MARNKCILLLARTQPFRSALYIIAYFSITFYLINLIVSATQQRQRWCHPSEGCLVSPLGMDLVNFSLNFLVVDNMSPLAPDMNCPHESISLLSMSILESSKFSCTKNLYYYSYCYHSQFGIWVGKELLAHKQFYLSLENFCKFLEFSMLKIRIFKKWSKLD